MKTHPNEICFPIIGDQVVGLTKRELFAAMDHAAAIARGVGGDNHNRARQAVLEADALIAALNKEAE